MEGFSEYVLLGRDAWLVACVVELLQQITQSLSLVLPVTHVSPLARSCYRVYTLRYAAADPVTSFSIALCLLIPPEHLCPRNLLLNAHTQTS